MWLSISSSSPSFATERLNSQLASISTIPVHLPENVATLTARPSTTSTRTGPTELSPEEAPNQALVNALHELSSSKPPIRERLEYILHELIECQRRDTLSTSSRQKGGARAGAPSRDGGGVDQVMKDEVIARAVTMIWKEVLDQLMSTALELESEKGYWESVLSSRRGVGVYFVQTLPHRIYRALPNNASFSLSTLTSLQTSSLFPHSPSAAISTLLSPYVLTRREVYSAHKAVTHARDSIATRIGVLASQGPKWSSSEEVTDLSDESNRIFGVICQVLESPTGGGLKRSRSDTITPRPISPSPSPAGSVSLSQSASPTPSSLLSILTSDLPRSSDRMTSMVNLHRRPGPLTRLWFPLLFVPPAIYVLVSTIGRNKEWIKEQLRNAKETVRGFFIQWVWEPLEGIGKTIRGGGEGLGVAPTTVKSDQESLERMVMDLGRDYYKLSPPQLSELGEEVKKGDMQAVLKVYEKEMQSPVKNALLGNLIRTLLIQVQKTKTDLSLSLLSLDHLLRSQQLTFAFVGVAPSVLILYGVGGWLRNVWRGESRGKGRRRTYFYGLRDIERLLLVAPKKEDQMSVKDRGLLIVAVSGMRSWASGLGSGVRDAFLDDLRLVEDPQLSRGDKIRAVERIWRSWGYDGRRRV